jgi:hypothetical protein
VCKCVNVKSYGIALPETRVVLGGVLWGGV